MILIAVFIWAIAIETIVNIVNIDIDAEHKKAAIVLFTSLPLLITFILILISKANNIKEACFDLVLIEEIRKCAKGEGRYELINEKGEKFKTITPDENGSVQIKDLPFGKYTIKEN